MSGERIIKWTCKALRILKKTKNFFDKFSYDGDSGDSGKKSTENKYPVYYHGNPTANISLYFLNDVNDLPYVEVDDSVELLKFLYQFDKPVELSISKSGLFYQWDWEYNHNEESRFHSGKFIFGVGMRNLY